MQILDYIMDDFHMACRAMVSRVPHRVKHIIGIKAYDGGSFVCYINPIVPGTGPDSIIGITFGVIPKHENVAIIIAVNMLIQKPWLTINSGWDQYGHEMIMGIIAYAMEMGWI